MLEIAVLGLLKEQPLHGYELKKRLSETLGFLWGVSYGSLYPALRRLEREGAIEVVSQPVERTVASEGFAATGSLKGDLAAARRAAPRAAKQSRRTRKAYRITESGNARFEQLLLADDPHADDEKAFALKLAFCAELPPAARLELLERRRLALLARLDRARRSTATRTDRYSRSLVEHRTRSTQRDLEWVEELIAAERSGYQGERSGYQGERSGYQGERSGNQTDRVAEGTDPATTDAGSSAPEPRSEHDPITDVAPHADVTELRHVQEGATR